MTGVFPATEKPEQLIKKSDAMSFLERPRNARKSISRLFLLRLRVETRYREIRRRGWEMRERSVDWVNWNLGGPARQEREVFRGHCWILQERMNPGKPGASSRANRFNVRANTQNRF